MSRRLAITPAMRKAIAEREGGGPGARIEITCAYCPTAIYVDWRGTRPRFQDADGRSTPELDHVIALALGGPHEVSNIVPACLRCNRSKCARSLHPDLLATAKARAEANA